MKSARLLSLLILGAFFGAVLHGLVAEPAVRVTPLPPQLETIGKHGGSAISNWQGVNLDDFHFAFLGPHQVEVRFSPDDFESNLWPPRAGRRGAVLNGSWSGRDYAVKIRPLLDDFQIHFPHERNSGSSWAEVYEIDLSWLPRLPEFLELLVEHREILLVMAGSAGKLASDTPFELANFQQCWDY